MQQLNQLYDKDSWGNRHNTSAKANETHDQPPDHLQNHADHMMSSNAKEETNSNAMTNSDIVRQHHEIPEEEDEDPEEGSGNVQQNFKCSIEIKNGLPVRSAQNVIKNQNSLVLNNYNVSIFLFSLKFLVSILLL